MAEPGRLAAIVLAAGSSTRLGQPKQLVLYGGETLLRRAARLAFAAGATDVIVVLGAHAEACRAALHGLGVVIVVNADYGQGMGSGLRAGMDALAEAEQVSGVHDALLLLVCDQPFVEPRHLQALVAAYPATGVAAAAYNGRAGVPAVFQREHFPALAQVTGDQGARSLLQTLPVSLVQMPEAAIDIDTPPDLLALQS